MIFEPIRLMPGAPGQPPAKDRTIFSLLAAIRWVQRYVNSEAKTTPRWVKLIAVLNDATAGRIDPPEVRTALHVALMAEGWAMPDELEQPHVFQSAAPNDS
ncbi:hypothetical protein CIW50_28350 [Tardiphaga sp. P9-11]|jgi:hypothetical protein|nr:hypothetical protein CIW50_28350 [Tardiphaga sp. P9-11]